MKIRYRPAALGQLDNIFDYIAQHNQSAAQRVIARIKASIDRLATLSYSARVSAVPGIRELPVVRYPYIVFYSVDEATQEIWVLRIRHTSQNPAHHLDEL